jgi:hypothetical protein
MAKSRPFLDGLLPDSLESLADIALRFSGSNAVAVNAATS